VVAARNRRYPKINHFTEPRPQGAIVRRDFFRSLLRHADTPGFVSARSYSYFVPAGHAVAPLQTNMLEALTGNLEKYLDLLTARQKLVASNIANADTPGYLTKDIDFQQEFMSMVNGQQPLTVNAPGLPLKPDGNNVNVDREARMLAENAMRFNVASVLLRGQINTVKEAITGGSSS
jgi:flagellar basal-body rod protein FlgB